MEYIEGSEILDEIAELGAYSEEDAKRLYKQILEGLAYLH
jgi:serine/threonine protein kinase